MEATRRDAMLSYKSRPEFYRRLYRVILRVVFVNSFVLAALCALTVYLGFYGFKPEHYFTTSPSGKIIELKYHAVPVFAQPLESQQSNAPAPAQAPEPVQPATVTQPPPPAPPAPNGQPAQ